MEVSGLSCCFFVIVTFQSGISSRSIDQYAGQAKGQVMTSIARKPNCGSHGGSWNLAAEKMTVVKRDGRVTIRYLMEGIFGEVKLPVAATAAYEIYVYTYSSYSGSILKSKSFAGMFPFKENSFVTEENKESGVHAYVRVRETHTTLCSYSQLLSGDARHRLKMDLQKAGPQLTPS